MEVGLELLEVDLGSLLRPLGGRFGGLLEVDSELSWKSISRALGGLVEVLWRSLGRSLEVAWKSSWQYILRYGADDAGTFCSLWNPGG